MLLRRADPARLVVRVCSSSEQVGETLSAALKSHAQAIRVEPGAGRGEIPEPWRVWLKRVAAGWAGEWRRAQRNLRMGGSVGHAAAGLHFAGVSHRHREAPSARRAAPAGWGVCGVRVHVGPAGSEVCLCRRSRRGATGSAPGPGRGAGGVESKGSYARGDSASLRKGRGGRGAAAGRIETLYAPRVLRCRAGLGDARPQPDRGHASGQVLQRPDAQRSVCPFAAGPFR